MEQAYHTIVVGAGIAGLNAARLLDEVTLVIDKKKEIGYPVQCGEGISLTALEREGIPIRPEWVQTYINHIKRIVPNGRYIGSRHDKPYALVIDRPGFEKHMASQVPWEIRMDTRITNLSKQDQYWVVETHSGETLKAKYIVGADGPTSQVAKTLFGITRKLVPGINHLVEFNKDIPANELQMYFGSHIAAHGYAWLFPTSRKTANIGLTRKTKGKIREAFFSFLDNMIKPQYGNFKLISSKSGVIPVDGFALKNPLNNAFLVGDAGGFTDPIFEGGMNMALFTGRLAAVSINQGDDAIFRQAVSDLPFSADDLLKARKIFYGFNDETLNALADVINGKSTSFLATSEGQKNFKKFPSLIKHQSKIFEFARIWEAAKPYIW